MKPIKAVMTALILAVCTSIGAADADRSSLARSALDAVLATDYESFAAIADEKVKQAINAEAFPGIAGALGLQFGQFREVLGFEPSEKDGFDIFVFDLDYERAVVKMMVALSPEAKVAGLRIVGAEQKAEWQPPAYVDISAFREEDVTVGATGFPLPGTLTLPQSEEKVPAFVLIHGSGPNDRDETIGPNKILKDIAWGLASQGFGVLRYEKRTKALPERFDVASSTLDDEVIDDALAAVEFLRSRSEVEPGRVYVLGHSLGGLAAPYVARSDERLAGMVVVAGPGRPMLDVLAYQIEHLSRLNDRWNDEAKAAVAKVTDIARRGRDGEDVSTESIMGLPADYWVDIDRRNAPAIAEGVGIPTLVIQGGRDYQVTMDCFAAWKAELSGKPFAVLVTFDDLNHLMIAGEGASTPGEYQETGHVDQRVIEAITRWARGDSGS